MGPLRAPSKINNISFPVFSVSWSASPTTRSSILAYCGGGGSARTGVFNSIVLLITARNDNDNDNDDDEEGAKTREVKIDTKDQVCVQVTIHPNPILVDGNNKNSNDSGGTGRRSSQDEHPMVLAAVGDEVRVYSVSLCEEREQQQNDNNDTAESEQLLLGRINVGKGYGCNAVSWNAMGNIIAVGCENSIVKTYALSYSAATNHGGENLQQQQQYGKGCIEFREMAECKGHTKAVCAVTFHPRLSHVVLSSAKDGTARLWDGQSGDEIGVLVCSVDDPNPQKKQKVDKKQSKAQQNRMKKPPQILVRGCTFGDLEGKIIYTVASERRGHAILSKWQLQKDLDNTVQGRGGGGAPPPPPTMTTKLPPPPSASSFSSTAPTPPSSNITTTMSSSSSSIQSKMIPSKLRYEEKSPLASSRRVISPVPISATSLSGDYTTLALGRVDGTILLYNVRTMKIMKQFDSVHDLPVTGIACRPLPLPLLGDEEEGVMYDAVSVSADNRLAYLTLQSRRNKKKSRKKATGISDDDDDSRLGKRYKSDFASFLYYVEIVFVMALIFVVAYVMKLSYETCIFPFNGGSFSGAKNAKRGHDGENNLLHHHSSNWGDCIVHTVLWADSERPGVRVVPH